MEKGDKGEKGLSRGRFGALLLAGFAETLGSFLVLALLPFTAAGAAASSLWIGVLVAAFAVAQTLSAPAWGRLSDRVGRRPVLLLGLSIATISYLMFAWAPSLVVLLFSRLLQGLAAGTVSVVFAYVADTVEGNRRAAAIGWVTAATSAAAMVGPLVGAVAVGWGPEFPGLVAAAVSLAALIAAAFCLPEPHHQDRRSRVAGPALSHAVWQTIRRPRAKRSAWILTYTLAMLCTSAVVGVASLHLQRTFGLAEDRVWPFFMVLAGVSLLVRALFLGRVIRRNGEQKTASAGLWVMVVAATGAGLAPSAAWLLVPAALLGVGQSLLYPCATALVSRTSGREEQGSVLGLQQAFGGSSRIVGPLAAALLFDITAPAPFLAAGLVLLIGWWLLRPGINTGEE